MCDYQAEEGKEFEDHWESHNDTGRGDKVVQCPFEACSYDNGDGGRDAWEAHLVWTVSSHVDFFMYFVVS